MENVSQKKADSDVVKLYIAGATPEELAEIQGLCKRRGWLCQPISRLGRKHKEYPVHIVLDAFHKQKTVRGAARVAGVSPGTAHRILKGAGKL